MKDEIIVEVIKVTVNLHVSQFNKVFGTVNDTLECSEKY